MRKPSAAIVGGARRGGKGSVQNSTAVVMTVGQWGWLAAGRNGDGVWVGTGVGMRRRGSIDVANVGLVRS